MAGPKQRIFLPGLNVRAPWCSLIAAGTKSIETRSYPISKKYLKRPLVLIETPGPDREFTARGVAVIEVFSCFKYKSKKQWDSDFVCHKVSAEDPLYNFHSSKEKWGWKLRVLERISPNIAVRKKGIIYARRCSVPLDNLSDRGRSLGKSVHGFNIRF